MRRSYGGKLESLLDQERTFSKSIPIVLLNSVGDCERRGRVEVDREAEGGFAEEKWMFQADILRAECNFLRMEREVALKKLEMNRIKIERTLRSAVQTLITGRKKICEGKSVSTVLEEEIKDLAEKLEELQRSTKEGYFQVRNCCNFDKQASLLQRQLGKLGGFSDGTCTKETREMVEESLSRKSSASNRKCSRFNDVEQLRRKMEKLSKGVLLKRMEEEYGPLLSTANSSVVSSASTSRRNEFPDLSTSSVRQSCPVMMSHEESACTGRCKVIVRRIIDQVRAETEQWSQMQEMLNHVREEMDELQASRDFWQDRALDTESQIQSLFSAEQECREKALSYENKVRELQAQISVLNGELERLRTEHDTEVKTAKGLSPPISRETQIEKEKRVLICRLKENHQAGSDNGSKQKGDDGSKQKELKGDIRRKAHTCSSKIVVPKRAPFRDIGNSSSLVRQNSKTIFPMHTPHMETFQM